MAYLVNEPKNNDYVEGNEHKIHFTLEISGEFRPLNFTVKGAPTTDVALWIFNHLVKTGPQFLVEDSGIPEEIFAEDSGFDVKFSITGWSGNIQ